MRVVHSGVWGFASSPIVSRPTRSAASSSRPPTSPRRAPWPSGSTCRLAPVPAYDEFYETPHERDPFEVPLEEKLAILTDATTRDPEEQAGPVCDRAGQLLARLEVPGDVGGVVHRAEPVLLLVRVRRRRPARKGQVKTRIYTPGASTAGYEFLVKADLKGNAERVAAEAVEHSMAAPVQAGHEGPGAQALAPRADHPRDHRAPDRTRSHRRLRGQLRRHQLREADRSRRS